MVSIGELGKLKEQSGLKPRAGSHESNDLQHRASPCVQYAMQAGCLCSTFTRVHQHV